MVHRMHHGIGLALMLQEVFRFLHCSPIICLLPAIRKKEMNPADNFVTSSQIHGEKLPAQLRNAKPDCEMPQQTAKRRSKSRPDPPDLLRKSTQFTKNTKLTAAFCFPEDSADIFCPFPQNAPLTLYDSHPAARLLHPL